MSAQRIRYSFLALLLPVVLALAPARARAQLDNGPDSHAPGDAPPWVKLKASYDVDSAKPPVVKEEPRDSTIVLTTHLQLTGPSGEQVSGAFMRPKADGVYPAVLLLHGLTSNKEAVLKSYGIALINHGFAVLALDAPDHGERKLKDVSQTDTDVFGNTIHEGCREYRRAIDWLAARKDIDPHRIGLVGYSLGAMMGAILGAVDDRVQDMVLCVGGDPIVSFASNIPEGKREKLYTISPSLFIGHISPRHILMLNGKNDMVMLETATERLYEAARQPKKLEWFDAGHILPYQNVTRSVGWLSDLLGPEPKKADKAG